MSERSASLAEVLDELTAEGAAELTEHLPNKSLRCYACGHRCLIHEGKRGICKVRYNEGGHLRVPMNYVAALACDPTEKKPFFHALPGSDTLTFGMLGCDLHCAYCLAPSMRIATTRGVSKIEDLFEEAPIVEQAPGAEIAFPNNVQVFSHIGAIRAVRGVFRHWYEGQMLKIHSAFCPPVECTPDHKLLAIKKPKHGGTPVEPEYVMARELTPEHCLALPRRCAFSKDVMLDVPEILAPFIEQARMRREISLDHVETVAALSAGGLSASYIADQVDKSREWVHEVQAKLRNGVWVLNELLAYGGKLFIGNEMVRMYNEHAPGIPRSLPLDSSLATLLGYYCAEGNIWKDTKRRANSCMLTFSFGLHEEAFARKTQQLLGEIFGVKARIEKRQTTLAVVLYKSSVALFFEALCGIGSANKRVPAQLFEAPPDVAQAFLTAYAEGDGCRERNGGVETATNSEELAYGVALLVLKSGRVPSLRHYLIPTESEILGRKIRRSPHQYLVRWYPDEDKRRCWKTDDYFFVPIRRIDSEEYQGHVYNMEVEEDHSYLTSFIVTKNCQNWVTSQSLRDDAAGTSPNIATPDRLVAMAKAYGAQLVGTSYNEPLITAEWAIEVFKRAKPEGFKTAFISNGNATPQVLDYIRPWTDCYKIDLKSMSDRNYRQLGGVVDNILETVKMVHERGFWEEIVTLVIPGFNDSEDELRRAADFIAAVSPDIPWHVTAFHQDYHMTENANTTAEQLVRACEIGREAGLRYIYAGNLPGRVGRWENTYCPQCDELLVERYGYIIRQMKVTREGLCPNCANVIPGVWK
ncbi:MAG TPA: radical SAM protein [Pyrinomonadaceae bacterium]